MTFEKSGRAIYTSHLDVVRTMQRAIKRAKLPVWYTEGYNPKIYLNFPLALSLGVESSCEPMEMAVVEDMPLEEMTRRLNGTLPDGMRILDCRYPKNTNKDIGFAEYEIAFSPAHAAAEAFDPFVAQEKIEIKKFTKKKTELIVDIKPYVMVLEKDLSDSLFSIYIRLPAGNDMNLNAGVFSGAFLSFAENSGKKLSCICTKRTKILCKNGDIFA